MIRRLALFITLLTLLLQGSRARAQSDLDSAISPPQADQFPVMSFNLDLHAPDGGFLYDLPPEQIVLLEDGQPVPVDSLELVEPGLELIVAVNAGPGLVRRDGEGNERYTGVVQTLRDWTYSAPLNPADTFSLLTNDQPAVHTSDIEALGAALEAYGSDFRQATPGIGALSAALDQVASLPAVPLQERAILYITPLPEGSALTGLMSLRARAAQTGARVFVWLVAPTDTLDSAAAQELVRLAAETEGAFIPYSGAEPPPDLEYFIEPLRPLYTVRYTSAARTAGQHTLDVTIALPEGQLVLPQQSYSLDIQPPNPIFLSPPARVTRTHPADSAEPLAELSPASLTIPVLVDFPDGMERALARLSLYVDGQLAAELTEPPFSEFTWDLSSYTTSGPHRLRLEVTDELGLTRSSMETSVDVQVVVQPVSLWTRLLRSNLLPAAGAVLAALVSLAAVTLLVYRRRRPKPAQTARAEALTVPLPARAPQPARPEGLHWPRRAREVEPDASLLRLDDSNEPVSGAVLPLFGSEITLGRDPTQSTCPLEDPAADELHARLRQAAGGYWLTDCGSLAGTWLNYSLVTDEGALVQHGDIIQVGRTRYRFQMREPGHSRKPAIQVYDERV